METEILKQQLNSILESMTIDEMQDALKTQKSAYAEFQNHLQATGRKIRLLQNEVQKRKKDLRKSKKAL